MIWVRRGLAVVLAIPLPALLLAVLVFWHVEGTFLSSEFWKGQLRQADMYRFLTEELPGTLLEEADTFQEDAPLTGEDVAVLIRDVVPPSWLQEQVEGALDQLFPFLTGDTGGFTIVIDLRDRKTALAESAGRFLEAKYLALPTCGPQEVPLGGGLPRCRPTGVPGLEALVASGLRVSLREEINRTLRDSFTLTDADLRRELPNVEDTRLALKQAQRASLYLGIGLALWLLVVGLLGGRGLWGRVQWCGVVATLCALFALGATLASRRLLDVAADSMTLETIPAVMEAKVRGLVIQIGEALFSRVSRSAVAILITSFAITTLAFTLPRLLPDSVRKGMSRRPANRP